VYSVAFLPGSGEKLASGGNDHKVRLWWVETGQEIDDIDPPMLHAGYHVYSVAFSPDGQKLASGESEGYVKLWWVESGDEITIGPMAHLDGQYVRSVAFSPDGQILASGGHDNYVRLWSVSDGTEILTIGNASDVETVAFSPVQ
jgi:WD40 repeat protein